MDGMGKTNVSSPERSKWAGNFHVGLMGKYFLWMNSVQCISANKKCANIFIKSQEQSFSFVSRVQLCSYIWAQNMLIMCEIISKIKVLHLKIKVYMKNVAVFTH